jgi:glucuronate isomerase
MILPIVLEHHLALKEDQFEINVLRPGVPIKRWRCGESAEYRAYLEKLSDVSGVAINRFSDLIEATS